MVLVLVLSLDTCRLGLVSFGLGLGLEPCGLVNITAGRFGPASGRTDAFCAPGRPTPGAAGRADSEYAECHCCWTAFCKQKLYNWMLLKIQNFHARISIYNDVIHREAIIIFLKFISNQYLLILIRLLILMILLTKVGSCKTFWSPLVFCVECDIKPHLSQSVLTVTCDILRS